MLAGAGFGDDPGLAHALGQQDLPEAVVDLVRAGVVQLVALEVDLRAAEMLGQPLGEIERRRPAGVMGVEVIELGLKAGSFFASGPIPLPGRGSAASAFRRRSGRRKCRTCPARRVRCGRNWDWPAPAAIAASSVASVDRPQILIRPCAMFPVAFRYRRERCDVPACRPLSDTPGRGSRHIERGDRRHVDDVAVLGAHAAGSGPACRDRPAAGRSPSSRPAPAASWSRWRRSGTPA
jgi:hypothetical protein